MLKAWRLYKIIFEKDISLRTYPLWGNIFFDKYKHNYQETIIPIEDFKSKYDLNINFVDFFALTHCLPRSWRGILFEIQLT